MWEKEKQKCVQYHLHFQSVVSIIRKEPLMNRRLKALPVLTTMSLNPTYHHRTMTSLLLVDHSPRLTNMVPAAHTHPNHRLVMPMNVLSSIHVV